ncbi:MAG: hypothetical protein LBD71_08125 [Treponema sp.]|jgi:hypothetical protein|nr:hypothetical protein [Treponema sp.]
MSKDRFFLSRRLLAFLLISGAAAAVSRPLAGEEAVFAPFVSRLKAEVKNSLLRLSWIDSQDARGPVYIYRSTRPFTESGETALLNPVTVPYGVQSYVDEPDLSRSVYYFVAASDESGRRYKIFIPNSNVVVFGHSGETGRETGIFGLEAKTDGAGVILSWRTSAVSRVPILYRSAKPLRATQDLLSALVVKTGPVPPFIDYPVPGIPCYYAVVFEDELAGGVVEIIPGANATVEAVEVRSETDAAGTGEMRSIPLPLISSSNGPRAPVPVSPEMSKAVPDIRTERTILPPRKPRAFREDLQAPAGGEESVIRAIVQGPFSGRDWETSRTELTRYLSLPREGRHEARAHFYLAQAWYFSGNYREALVEFLAVQPVYPQEANEWIEDTLSRLID